MRLSLTRATIPFVALPIVLAALTAPARGQAERMVAMGDSITLGVGDELCNSLSSGECGYPRRLEVQLASRGRSVDVINMGIGGENTAEGLSRVNQVLNRGGSVLLLMEGTNDLQAGIPPTSTRFNLNQIAQAAQARGYQVVHATVIPRPPWSRRDVDNLVTAEQAGQIRSMAYARLRRLVDPFERFGAEENAFTHLYSREANDFVGHPNAAGYDFMARLFAEVLLEEDLTPPVRGVIEPLDGAVNVPAGALVQVELIDFGTGIDPEQTRLTIDDAVVPAVQTVEPRRVVLTYQSPTPLRNVVRVGVESRDRATPPRTVDRVVSTFTIAGTTFLPGDLDRSGRVDGADLVAFARRFGAREGESRYLAAADFNSDGVTNGVDLAVLAGNFGRSSF